MAIINDDDNDVREKADTTRGSSLFGKDHFQDLEGAKGPDEMFRPFRFTPGQLNADRAFARIEDEDHEASVYPVLNISSSGIAIASEPRVVFQNGQILENLKLFLDGVLVHEGRAVVIHQRADGDQSVVGIAFADDYLPLSRLENVSRLMKARKTVEDRLERVQRLLGPCVPDWIKILVSDFRVFAREIKEALDQAVPVGSSQELEDSAVKAVEERIAPTFQNFISRLAGLPSRSADPANDEISRYLKAQMRDLLMPAPIYRQSLFKPLGYAGDYVVMNIAYTNHYQGDSAYAKFVNRMFCQISISRAAIARVPFLKGWIERVVREHPGEVSRITTIASGPAREVQEFLSDAEPDLRAAFTLFDQDALALSFAQSALSPFARRFGDRVTIRYVNGAVKHLVKDSGRYGILKEQDLVYTAGLFDYLKGDVAALLAKQLFDLLRPGGYLVIGNLTNDCDSRGFLEYLVDWNIIYRSDEEIRDFARYLKPADMWIEQEETGINHFLVIKR